MPRKIQRYGWKPSLPDHRRRVADTSGITVLPEVDPRNELPPIFDQGQLGSCTANATAAAFQYDGMLDGKDPGHSRVSGSTGRSARQGPRSVEK